MRPTSFFVTVMLATSLAQAQQSLEAEPRAAISDSASTPEPAGPKVSAAVREQAAKGGPLRVYVVLPPAGQQDVQAIRQRYRDYIQFQDGRAKQFQGERERKAAAAERDRSILRERAEIAAVRKAAYAPLQERLTSRVRSLGGRLIERLWALNALYVELPAAAIDALENDPDVLSIQAAESKQLHLGLSPKVLGAPAFWDAGYRGGTQVVAVIDSGIAPHAGFDGLPIAAFHQFEGAMATGCVDTSRPLDNVDTVGHGTHVSGIIAAQRIPGIDGATGVAPGIAGLVSVRVGAPGLGNAKCGDVIIESIDIFRAIQFIVEETPARVINISIGAGTRLDDQLENWVVDQNADLYDIAFSISAGNEGKLPISPQLGDLAHSYNVVTVASVDTGGTFSRGNDKIADYSSKGPTKGGRRKPDVAAPGSNIASLYLDGAVSTLSGTSMAAPHIAGAVALLLDSGVGSAKAAKALLINSTDSSGWARDWGWGSANLEAAFRQRNYVQSAELGAGQARYYRLNVSGSTRASLVWNRHIAGISPDGGTAFGDFRDLNLYAYDESSNRLIDSSTSRIDNVEQIAIRGEGSALIKVFHNSTDRGSEAYALAFSSGAYEEVRPGSLSLRCTAPGEVAATMKYLVDCTLSNNGTLPVFGISLKITVPNGFRTNSFSVIDRLQPGQQATFRYEVTSPITSVGQVTYAVQAAGGAFGDVHSASAPLLTNFRVPKPQNCTPSITPGTETLILQSNAQVIAMKIAFPFYDPQEPGVCSWTAVEYSAFTQFTSPRTGTGNGDLTLSVTQSNANSIYTTRTGEVRFTVNGTNRYPWTFKQYYRK